MTFQAEIFGEDGAAPGWNGLFELFFGGGKAAAKKSE